MDVEFRIIADRKERLLFEMGQTVIRGGFSLLRQRLADGPEGPVLTLLIRGPNERVSALEETLATNPRVHSFEALAREETVFEDAAATGPTQTVKRPTNGTSNGTSNGASNGASNGLPTRTASTTAAAEAAFDPRRIESVLPNFAQDYPKIFPRLLALARDLGEAQRRVGLRYVGSRVGAWVYKRDFILGGKLSIEDSINHIALPAARQLLPAEASDSGLRIKTSPLCHHTGHGADCHFFEGFFEGLLNEAGNLGRVRVSETFCRATGSDSCLFEFRV